MAVRSTTGFNSYNASTRAAVQEEGRKGTSDRNGADVGTGMDKYGNSTKDYPPSAFAPSFPGMVDNGGPVSNAMNTRIANYQQNAMSTNSDTENTTGTTTTEDSGTNEGGEGGNPSWPGMFNFQGIMDAFYAYKPGENDELGNAIKQTFASNMIQSAFDKEMAKEMGEFQNALGQSNMNLAAQLELQNNSALMEEEFKYGMQSMDAQFGYQNQFADNQYTRDVGLLGAQGEQQRLNQDNQSFNNRAETIVAGEQQRETDTNRIQETGKEQRETDTNRITTEGQEQRATDTNRIQETGKEQRATDTNRINTEGEQQRQTDTNRLTVTGEQQRLTDSNRIQETGREQRATDTNRLTVEGDQTRQTRRVEGEEQRATDTNRITTTGQEQRLTDTNRINTQGEDNRKTMDFGNRLEARTRADNRKYARMNARNF